MSKESISAKISSELPRRSLFGSNLDLQKQMTNINYQHFLSGQWKKDNAKKTLKSIDSQILFDLRAKLEEQKAKTKKTASEYNESKENALKFITQKDVDSERSSVVPSQRSQAGSVQKFHSSSFQQLNPSQTEKLGYKLNGSILDLSYKHSKPQLKTREMSSLSITHSDYKNNLEELKDYNSIQMKHMNSYYPTRDQLVENYKSSNNDRVNSTISSKSSISFDEIPQNLKAKFKENQVAELMKNQEKVDDTIAKLQLIEDAKKRIKTIIDNEEITRPVSASIDPKQNAVYYDLSNYLRHAVCHGYPDLKKRSFKESVHNADVNKEYLADPENYTLKNRRKKDWLGKWTESKIVRDRLYKGLAEATKKADA